MANLTEQETAMKTDFEKKLQLAEQGDAHAQFHVGLVYTKGINEYQEVLSEISLNEFPYPVKHDDALAFQWFEKAAKQGIIDAQHFLGLCYSKGLGVKQDYAQAIYWHKKAAEQGNRNSQDILGFYYYSEQDYQQAIDWFKKAAEQGDFFAQYRLACCYRDGVGVEQNNQFTFEWFNKCAESYVQFGWNYDSYLYCMIAMYKDMMCDDIYYRLADCYFNGVGIEVNQKKGFELIKERYIHVETNRYSVPANVDRLYDKKNFLFGITYGESEKKLIQQWMTESNQGNIETQYRLAVAYFDDNDSNALYVLNDALKNNHPAAHQWLEAAYLNIVFPYLTDRADAEQYYQAAFEYCSNEANREFEEVYFCLGVLYACGKGVEQNKELAFRNFSHIVNETGFRLNPFDEYDELQILAEYYLLVTNYYDGNNKGDEQFLWDYVQTYFKFLAEIFNKNTTLHHPVLPAFTMKTVCEMGDSLGDEMGDFESARKRFSSNRDRMLKEVCSHIIDKEEQLYKKNKELEEKNKELNNLIAMFAHNFLGTLQCIRSNAEHDNNAKIHLKTVKMMSGALTAFSIISADDDKLIEQLKQDNTGETNLLQNLANNLALAISQLLSKTNKDKIINLYLNYLRKTNQIEKDTTSEELRENREYRKKWQALQHQWEDEFNASFSENVELSSLQNWLADNFFPVQITGFDNYNIRFKEYGITDSIFLVVFMEILVNALKYMDVSQNQPLILTLEKQDQHYHLICENPSSQETYRGTHKGMDFLKSIARKLNAQFITESTEQQFKTIFIIPAELLD